MKKLYAIAAGALLAALPMSARQLTFYLGNTAITPDSKVEYREPVVNDDDELYLHPALYLESDMPTAASVTLVAKCVSGQSIEMCAGGNCMAGPEVTKEGLKLQGNQKLDLQFEYVNRLYLPGEPIPEVVTEFSAVDTKYPDTKVEFTLVMGGGDASVSDVFANDSDFRAVSGGIEYTFSSPVLVELFSTSGEKVLAAEAEGTGFLSTSSLAPGVYLYKAGAKSGKVYIR